MIFLSCQTGWTEISEGKRVAYSSRVSTVALGYFTRRLSEREKPLRSQIQAVHRGNKILSQLLQRRAAYARLACAYQVEEWAFTLPEEIR